MKLKLFILSLLLPAAGFCQSISTEAPSVSASAVTVPKGFLQGELSGGISINRENDNTVISSGEAPFLLARYGLSDRWEVRLQNSTTVFKALDKVNYNYSQFGIGVKYAILPNDGNTNLAVIGTFSPFVNDWKSQLGDLTFAVSQTIGENGSLGGNVGYSIFSSNSIGENIDWVSQTIRGSVVYSHQLMKKLTGFGEFFSSLTQTNLGGSDLSSESFGIDFGLQYLLKENIQLDWVSGFYLNSRNQFHSLGFNVYFDTKKKIMEIKEVQKIVDDWINEYGVRYFDELTNTAMLMEEVGEVARIMARRYGEQSEKESDKNKDLGDEMADVLFVLVCLANQTGIDLEEAVRKNLEKKTNRDHSRHKENKKLQ